MKNTTIPASKIKKNDVLIDAESGDKCLVLSTSRDEIAWHQPYEGGGAFGQCERKTAPSLFKNVTA